MLVFLVALLVFLLKAVIDLYALLSMVRKDKQIISQDNEKEVEYEFIKGLH
ncbi:hypothetical protein [Pedobacter cryoconitis]|uniref:hypothetical protein n=1 Tax=Pedobacter cryoconitis TaxID=188932 RepID=UPI001C84ACE2|nr:hypothetical protein [Pedobacter cryoconitis]